MKKYPSLELLVEDLKKGIIPSHVISPGAAAFVLGITRQAVHQRLKSGSIPAWTADGVILVDADSVVSISKKKQGIARTQGVLNVTT